MKKKKIKKVKTLNDYKREVSILNKKIEELEDNKEIQTASFDRIRNALDTCGGMDNIMQAIGRLKQCKVDFDLYEHGVSEALNSLRAENSKLWYMVRLSLHDETIKSEPLKPGEEQDYNRRGINRPF